MASDLPLKKKEEWDRVLLQETEILQFLCCLTFKKIKYLFLEQL